MRPALVALGVLLLLVLAAGLVFAGSASRIAAGVTISGVDVGGLTVEEAEAKLTAAAERSAAVPVVFTAGEERFSVRPASLGVRSDWAAAAEQAVDRGDWPLPARGLQRLWLRSRGAEVEPAVSVYEPALRHQVALLASGVDQPAREAAIVLDALEPRIVPGQPGRVLDQEAAAGVVTAALARFERLDTPLPVAVERPTVTQATLVPVAADVRTMLSAPVRLTFKAASEAVRPAEIARLLRLPAGGETEVGIREGPAARRFQNVARGVARRPRSADFTVRPNGRVRVVPSRAGRELDVAATSAALLDAASRPTGRTAPIAVTQIAPEVTTREARGLKIERQLASYSTLYSGTADRIRNLQLAVEALDGARIGPGETWSFNERVGPRTLERGYRPAPVILDGKYEEGVGGGVSQVATTVFNAAWEAGIKIAGRTAHALYISRYPTGRDATVNYPDVDLKLLNDTGRWIVMKAAYDESGIVVRLLGGGPERRVESIPGELKVTGPPKTEKEPDPTLYVGDRIVEFDGEPSRTVTVERIVYRGGEVLYRETWTTNYRSEARIVRVGTKPRPATPPPDEDKPKDEDEETPPPGDGTAARRR